MTRAENVAMAQELRERGLLVREIAARMGAPCSTVASWLGDPDLSKLRARKATYGFQACVDCGSPTASGSASGYIATPRCDLCHREKRALQRRDAREARRRDIERRWLAGETVKQIAEALRSTPNSIGVAISTMRREGGYHLPFRNPAAADWACAHPEHVARMREIGRAKAAA